MNTGKAIFFGLALIALAIFARDIVKPADANPGDTGRYMITSAGDRAHQVWVIETSTGRYRRCNLDGKCGSWKKSQ